MKMPIAVLTADVHYNLQTLKLADAAVNMAIDKANSLGVPLIVAGDLHDTKANLRGECMNAMLKTFDRLDKTLNCYILRGNHDAINEKSKEHSLGFLNRSETYSTMDGGVDQAFHRVITEPGFYNKLGAVNGMSVHLIPYQHDPAVLRAYLKRIDAGSCVIMHQGLQKANSGDYFQDHSALTPDDVAGMRVISGHYHTRQAIKLPNDGVWDFLGNPYSLTWGEAQDLPKGFQVLYNDGSLEFVPTNLRKHVELCLEVAASGIFDGQGADEVKPGDLVWAKVHGPKEFLDNITRGKIAKYLGFDTFKLDLIPTAIKTITPKQEFKGIELVDSLIDSLTNTTDDRKSRLKELARNIGT